MGSAMGTGTEVRTKAGLYLLPILCGLVPVIAVHIGYWISIRYGTAPACMPYIDGCVSISGAGRHPPAVHLYRLSLIPVGTAMLIYWPLCRIWLQSLGDRSRASLWVLTAAGMVGALFLMVYAVFLGTEGPTYDFLRRFGIMQFYALTFLAQLLFTYRLVRGGQTGALDVPAWLTGTQYALVAVLLVVGFASIPIKHFWDLNAVDNVIEWTMSPLLMAHFVLVGLAWRWSRFTLHARTG